MEFSMPKVSLGNILQQVKQATNHEIKAAEELVINFKGELTEQRNKLQTAKDNLLSRQRYNQEAEEQLLLLQQQLRQKQQLWQKEQQALKTLSMTIVEHGNLLLERVKPSGLWGLDTSGFQTGLSQDVDIKQIYQLWQAFVEQLLYTSEVHQYDTSIIMPDGVRKTSLITQWGPFTSHSQFGWLSYLPEHKVWQVFSPQPDIKPVIGGMRIDPSLGKLLQKKAQESTLFERLRPAGIIGVLIAIIGAIAVFIAAVRCYSLCREQQAVQWQILHTEVNDRSSLGRILNAVEIAELEQAKDGDITLLEAVIDAAVLKEVPVLRKGLASLAVLTGIPPLLGLLGTVAGMIETFRVITEQGSANSQLLSGGIAQALLTTELGLIVAVPLLLIHCGVKTQANRLIVLLEQQAAGLVVARHSGWQQ